MSYQDYGLGGRGSHLVIVSVVGSILAAVLVFNRVYWRIEFLNAIGHDDICILLALIFLFALALINIVAVDSGYGRPSATLSPENIKRALQMFYLNQIVYKLSINFTKISILLLYLRIFSPRTTSGVRSHHTPSTPTATPRSARTILTSTAHRLRSRDRHTWFRLFCLTTLTLVACYTVASVLVTIFQCTPVSYAWNKSSASASPSGKCISNRAFWYANATFNILTDAAILASIPGLIWSLHLPLRSRWALTGVFGLGIFVFATSVLRFTTLPVSTGGGVDVTGGTYTSTVWTMVEASCAVGVACLPMVRTPLGRIWPGLCGGDRRGRERVERGGRGGNGEGGVNDGNRGRRNGNSDTVGTGGDEETTRVGEESGGGNDITLDDSLGKGDAVRNGTEHELDEIRPHPRQEARTHIRNNDDLGRDLEMGLLPPPQAQQQRQRTTIEQTYRQHGWTKHERGKMTHLTQPPRPLPCQHGQLSLNVPSHTGGIQDMAPTVPAPSTPLPLPPTAYTKVVDDPDDHPSHSNIESINPVTPVRSSSDPKHTLRGWRAPPNTPVEGRSPLITAQA